MSEDKTTNSNNQAIIEILQNIIRVINTDDPARRKQVIQNSVIAIVGTGGLMALKYFMDKREKEGKI
jgi:hypothetical protein